MPLQDHVRGALCLVTAALLFAVMASAVKAATAAGVSNEMVVFFRNAVGLATLLPWLARRGLPALKTPYPLLHLLRGAAGLASMYCFFFAIGRMPLGDVMVLNYTAPLFVPLFALAWLHEAVPARLWFALAMGFAGIVVILRPGMTILSPAAVIGLASGLLAAAAIVVIRRMRRESSVRIVFYYSAVATALSAVPLAWTWRTPGLGQALLLAVTGMLATGGQLLLTRGYSLAAAARVGPFMYSAVIFATLLGWLLWGEVPDAFFMVGAALVCLAGIISVRRHAVAAPEGTPRLVPAPGRRDE